MTEVKRLKVEQELKGVKELYNYLVDNSGLVAECTGIKIKKLLKDVHFCVIGQEEITKKKILFYATKADVIESFGELMILASQSDANIIVTFLPKASISWQDTINWLQIISNNDYKFIICEADF